MRPRQGTTTCARYMGPLVVLSLLLLMTVREPHPVSSSQHAVQKQSAPLKDRGFEQSELDVVPPTASFSFIPPPLPESSNVSSVITILPRRHLEFSVFSRPPPLA